jgi:acyl-CoA synthetase (AMP-forming)/AMP-acid ligase II/tetratricopeptide (TPR) repeat protein
MLAAHAQSRAEAPALAGVGDAPRLNYAHMHDFVVKTGTTLRAAGIGPGDIVICALPDGPDAFAALLATTSAGAALPVSPVEASAVYERMFDELDIRAVLMGDRPQAALTRLAAARDVTLLRVRPSRGGEMFDIEVERPRPERDDIPCAEDAAIIMATSGSTGAPKYVSITHQSLLRSAQSFADWNELKSTDRSLCVMPIAHLHSLIRSTLPVLVVGGEVIWAPGFRASDAIDWIESAKPTMITGAPTIFRALLAECASRNWRPGDDVLNFVAIGSDKVEHDLTERIEAAFGCHVAQFYGLSETSPFVALTPRDGNCPPGAAGKLNPDWDVFIVDDDGCEVLTGKSGQIAIRGGYVNQLIGRSAAEQESRFDREGRYLTGDLGHLDGDGFLYVDGRVDDRIARGGEKIAPQIVENVLAQHPGVARAVVFALPDTLLGSRVAALVEPNGGAPMEAGGVRAFAVDRLERAWVPDEIICVDAIPTTRNGKISRREIARDYAHHVAPAAAAVSSATPTLGSYLLEMLREHARNPALGEHDQFLEHGGDSFAALGLLLEIEKRFGVSLAPAVLVQSGSAAGLAKRVSEAMWAGEVASVVDVGEETPSAPTLVFAPGPNNAVGYALRLTAAWPQQHFLFLNSSGLNEDPVQRTLSHLSQELAPAVESRSVGELIVGGFSIGAHVALALTRRLIDNGRNVRFVAVIDDLADLDRRDFGLVAQPPKDRNVDAWNRWALACAPAEPFPGRVVLFVGESTLRTVSRSDPTGGWDEIALGGVDVMVTPGDHTSILRGDFEPFIQALQASVAAQRGPLVLREYDTCRRLRFEARAAGRRGDLAAEIDLYRRAAAEDANQPYWAYGNLADALWQAGDGKSAFKAFREAIARDPWPLTTDTRFARRLRRRPRALAAAIERARAVTPDDPITVRQLAKFFIRADRSDAAETVLREGLDLDPTNATLQMLARVFENSGRSDQAEKLRQGARNLAS